MRKNRLAENEIRDTLWTILPSGFDLGSCFRTIVNSVSMLTGIEAGLHTALYDGTKEVLTYLLDNRLIRVLDCDAENWPQVEGSSSELIAWTFSRWEKKSFGFISPHDIFFYETTDEGHRLYEEMTKEL